MENPVPYETDERNIPRLLNDRQITGLALEHQMITPYVESLVRAVNVDMKVISFGQSSYGYDIRVADDSLFYFRKRVTPIDPKEFDAREHLTEAPVLTDPVKGRYVIIPPNTVMLARSVEYMRMPKNVTGICLGKSTYARSGYNILATPLEAGWEGNITLEIANCTPTPGKLYVDEGIMQVLFFLGDECESSYKDRQGKYQGQTGLTLAKV